MEAIKNRKAYFDYAFSDKIEAGIVLSGDEVKAVRSGKVSLAGSFAKIFYNNNKPELFLVNAHISDSSNDQAKTRKLLVHKKEISRLIGSTQQKGLTVIPTKIYFKNGKVKIELQLGKGLQKVDKRELIKKRDTGRELRVNFKRP